MIHNYEIFTEGYSVIIQADNIAEALCKFVLEHKERVIAVFDCSYSHHFNDYQKEVRTFDEK